MPAIEISSGIRDLQLNLWEIEEELAFFLKEIHLTSDEDLEIESMLGKRQTEFAVQRFLLNRTLKGIPPLMKKTKNGKPFLSNRAEKISISHSKNMLLLSTASVDHGVDLEWVDERIIRLASKFCNNSELSVPHFTNIVTWYTLIWSCKESLYKVDGLGQLEFRTQLAIHFTEKSYSEGWGRGIVKREDKELFFRVFFKEVRGFIVTWAYPSEFVQH